MIKVYQDASAELLGNGAVGFRLRAQGEDCVVALNWSAAVRLVAELAKIGIEASKSEAEPGSNEKP